MMNHLRVVTTDACCGIFGTSTIEAASLSTNAALNAGLGIGPVFGPAGSISGVGPGFGLAYGPATAADVASNAIAPTGLLNGASLGSISSSRGFGVGSAANDADIMEKIA